mmetsp:Transcript_349/g.1199  ORF Transcript_349/g.1199 Transcript_349/m.1199 type:complete len:205 (-) Transcript_349:5301-5915(-)
MHHRRLSEQSAAQACWPGRAKTIVSSPAACFGPPSPPNPLSVTWIRTTAVVAAVPASLASAARQPCRARQPARRPKSALRESSIPAEKQTRASAAPVPCRSVKPAVDPSHSRPLVWFAPDALPALLISRRMVRKLPASCTLRFSKSASASPIGGSSWSAPAWAEITSDGTPNSGGEFTGRTSTSRLAQALRSPAPAALLLSRRS